MLADAERTLGRRHEGTCAYTVILASEYKLAARVSLAISVLESVAPRFEEVYGSAAEETLQLRAILADAYRMRGHSGKAVELLEQILVETDRRGFDTGTTQDLLATAYVDAGRYDAALATYMAAYAAQLESFGESHPATLIARHNLARVRREAGQIDEGDFGAGFTNGESEAGDFGAGFTNGESEAGDFEEVYEF